MRKNLNIKTAETTLEEISEDIQMKIQIGRPSHNGLREAFRKKEHVVEHKGEFGLGQEGVKQEVNLALLRR